MTDINALNNGNPYDGKTLSPHEELYGIISPVQGIPMTKEAEKVLVDREILSERKTRSEVRNTNPRQGPFNPEDTHPPTREENKISKHWIEKINGNYDKVLTCGDRVYYVDHPRAKGAKRWRAGVIIKRKQDYEYSTGIRASHGYDI